MNPTAQTSPERKNATTPSAGALRAAESLLGHIDQIDDTQMTRAALVIDRESGAAELARTLQRLAEKVRRANAIQHSGRTIEAEDWSELYDLQSEAFGVLERHHSR